MVSAARAFLDLTGARFPVIQAPMAGFAGADLASAAIGAGAVGSLACATLDSAGVISEVAAIRGRAEGPLNLNFFCHTLGQTPDDSAWRDTLAPFYTAEGVAPPTTAPTLRRPFDLAMAEVVEQVRPEIVSFHFGLPAPDLLAGVRASGALIFGNATNLAEARWLAAQGCDAIIAQGSEAGGHAGHFLDGHHPVALANLVPQIVAAVDVPVIAAGGIADAGDVRAAMAQGAGAVQVGTAYLRTPESLASATHRVALDNAGAEDTVFTNLFSGGMARGLRNRLINTLGPVHAAAPRFPYASAALAPLRAQAEREGRGDYSPLWAGAGVHRANTGPAADLTRRLGAAALVLQEQHA
ncbi:NAD(P)H-dependent flavin oxidoreductase [Sphingomonas immobilis]|uniref:Propionate 3-nitronate monooxygenase n=1 Tax=Sphingomonas immobilis TaxID=3063997 RepID=A0ABT9A3S9_9SPHN|nr:nitronate monooxygenase [Sphingomonas sp. CA1-15]MDO7844499.1 nitronate monooxygenase [Sphingomonas sp. CA1-15]